ncbi:MAG: apolipoprotein N-acyltransferase [Bdellovibrionales bacterium RBG_16_40_8]|nr:MAG: apolipoprotein N-acyltransferase [Bdellovibrionales bacterium RBG_16_40_8]
MRKLSSFFTTYYLSIISGILIGTSYIPFPPWASFFCFIPLWRIWLKLGEDSVSKTSPYKRIFFAGWLTQFVFTLIGFNWVALTVHEFGYLPWPVAIITLILFCSVANFDVPIAGVFWFYLQKKYNFSKHTSLALLAIVTALSKTWALTLFPWNYGYTWLWSGLPIAQNAELIGFQGLSIITILLNLGFYRVYEKWCAYKVNKTRTAKRELIANFLYPAIIILFLNLTGYILLKSLPPSDQELKILAVQANIGNLQKQYAERGLGFREYITERYLNLSYKAMSSPEKLSNVDLMVWPETAYPYDLDQRLWSSLSGEKNYLAAARRLIDLTQKLDTHLITGGYGFSPHDNKLTNTFFMVEKTGAIQPNPYYKTILLAFGEYLPGGDYFPRMKEWFPAVGDFSRGLGPQVKSLNIAESPHSENSRDLLIGPLICYEGLFSSLTRALSNQGAEVFINLTNDSWYGTWAEPYQHLYMTLARAIEFRRPIIRVTNTGITTVGLASGKTLAKSPLNSEWTGFYSIPYRTKPTATIYQLYPWLMEALLIFMIVFIIGRASLERFKKS